MIRSKPAARSPVQFFGRCFRRLKDLAVTLVLWSYFTAGFVVLFAPFYLVVLVAFKDRKSAFQHLNHLFFKGFFKLCRLIIPRHKWEIQSQLSAIRSSIIVCNHLSYLDSILLISLYPKHTTIAKERLFAIPIFGMVVKHAGYIPSSGRGRYAELLLNSLEAINANLEQGGNIIIFPEGTRSRDGRVGQLRKGAFKIAKYCKAPIQVLKVGNTEKLFPPGKFLFNTCIDNTISLKQVGELTPQDENGKYDAKHLMAQFHALLDGKSHSEPG
ncbi:MAG: lysophospholipid acyltransferase family protein [Desulfobacteraceae bacterium]|jgi:1-acyl-sn-glycerol-3-phosphate acyltransferase